MGFINTVKSWFRKGGAAMGIVKSLGSITDDDRIATDSSENNRIKLANRYYSGSYLYKDGIPANTVYYFNSQNERKSRHYFSVNITQMVAKRIASICLNSGFNISLGDSDDDSINKLADWVTDWLDESGVNRVLESKLEQGIPNGGFAARPYVDNGKIKVSWIRADQFFSLDSNTEEISQAAIASQSTKTVGKKRYYYTLLEFHQWLDSKNYQVTNELYRSDSKDVVGEQVPLGTDDMYNDLESQAVFSNFKRPMFVYFKCPGQNNLAPESPLGVGFVNNCRNVLDAINMTHDAFVWETRMGRRKVLVPPETVRQRDNYSNDDELHVSASFDPDQDVYMGIEGLGESTGNPVVQINPDIRVDDYEKTMEFFLHELENSVGLSNGTFTTDSKGGVTTATQVVSENSMTYQTRSSYLNRVTKFLVELIQSVVQLAETPELFDGHEPLFSGIDVSQLTINVHYDDGVFVDKDQQAKQDMLAVQANIMPAKRFLMRNYGLSEADAEIWLNEVQSEAPEEPNGENPNESDIFNGGD
jgi:A118 family predicted phage portal protein